MKIKINIFIITLILTVIVFVISTYIQKQLIDYEATISCLVLTKDISENEAASEDKFKYANVPISMIANQRVVTNFEELEGLYAKDNIRLGQIAIKNQFDTKENLSIYEAEDGKEKISIKVKSAENGMSFQIKEKSMINIYATIRNEYANDFLLNKDRLSLGDEYDGYTVIKLLTDVQVLGAFTANGIEIEKSDGDNIDSILIAVTSEEAKEINLIREMATFNITGVNNKKEIQNEVVIINNLSGDGI